MEAEPLSLSARAGPPAYPRRAKGAKPGPPSPRKDPILPRRALPLFALPLLLAAAAPPAAPGPEAFFVGRTEGAGDVHVILSGRHGVRDRSRGHIERGGALVLEQIVEEEGSPPRTRSWRLMRIGPNRFTGTISDARGAVAGEVAGNVLHLRYRSVEGPSVEQWVTIHANGRSAQNHMVFRRFGFTVATLDAVIRRLD